MFFARLIWFLVVLESKFVFGQNNNFEFECNILQQLDDLKNEVGNLKQQITQLTKQVKDKSGSTYIRWGRTTCPGNGSELVYHGAAGGTHHDHTGGAANYLCMPLSLDPEYGTYSEPGYQSGGEVYGVEYRLQEISYKKFFPDSVPDLSFNDVPCAQCRVDREAILMIPARVTCPDGWTLEYKGYLMAGNYGHPSASEYICVDGEPEILTGGAAEQDGRLVKFVEGRCGSLPCPPYKGGWELTCSVCTK